jgi:hypothetical protein
VKRPKLIDWLVIISIVVVVWAIFARGKKAHAQELLLVGHEHAPSAIIVNGSELWKIVYTKDPPWMRVGYMYPDRHIELWEGLLNDPAQHVETLFEELEHAAVCCDKHGDPKNHLYNNRKHGWQHPGIRFSSKAWRQLVQENPDLMQWAMRQLQPSWAFKQAPKLQFSPATSGTFAWRSLQK